MDNKTEDKFFVFVSKVQRHNNYVNNSSMRPMNRVEIISQEVLKILKKNTNSRFEIVKSSEEDQIVDAYVLPRYRTSNARLTKALRLIIPTDDPNSFVHLDLEKVTNSKKYYFRCRNRKVGGLENLGVSCDAKVELPEEFDCDLPKLYARSYHFIPAKIVNGGHQGKEHNYCFTSFRH